MLNINRDLAMNMLWSIVVLFTVYSIKFLLLKVLHHKIADSSNYYKAKRVVNTIAFLIIALSQMLIWFHMGGSISTYLGLFSAGVALALKDILINIAAWFYIIFKTSFVVGDRIEIAGVKGDVIDQRVFQFSMIEMGNWVDADQSTGRIIHMPNHKIFTDHLANYTTGFEYIWNEIKVLITFESDWKKAKMLLKGIVNHHTEDITDEVQNRIREASKKYLIYYNNLTPIVYTDVKESGVLLTLRYICEPQARRTTTETIWEAILDEFSLHQDIDLAYPTRRVVNDKN